MGDDRNGMRAWAWLLPVVLAAVVWLPLTQNYFHADDFLDLYQLRNESPARYYLRMHGGHLLIARHAVTAALDTIFGPNPQPFFWVVLMTHLLNTALLYVLIARLTDRWPLAVIAAAAWGSNQVNEGALGWYAVYGQVVAATCILVVLVGLTRPGADKATGWPTLVAWALLMVLAGMLFGIGLGAALLMPAAAWLLLPPGSTRRRAVSLFVAAGALLLVTYVVVHALEVPLYGESQAVTAFMISELTPAFAIQDLRMLAALVGFGLATLPFDGLTDPNVFPTPTDVALMAAGGGLLVAGAWLGTATARRRLLACMLVVAGAHGLIAVGRSGLVARFAIGLGVAAASPRYHYATGALLIAAVAVAADATVRRWVWPAWVRQVAFVLALAAVGWGALVATRPIDHFDADRQETARVLADVRAAVDAAPPGATVEIPNRQFVSVGFLTLGSPDRFPGTAAIYAIFHPTDVVDGRRIVFTTRDAVALRGAITGRRSASLLREQPAARPAP